MRFISRRTHGILDYIIGVFLLACPWLFGFTDQHIPMLLAVLVGATTLFMSLITDYEMGLLRFLPFNGHRFFDLLLGLGLVGAPIHFAISGIPGVIFVLAGVIALGSTLLTRGGDPTDGRLTPMEPRHGSAH